MQESLMALRDLRGGNCCHASEAPFCAAKEMPKKTFMGSETQTFPITGQK